MELPCVAALLVAQVAAVWLAGGAPPFAVAVAAAPLVGGALGRDGYIRAGPGVAAVPAGALAAAEGGSIHGGVDLAVPLAAVALPCGAAVVAAAISA